MTVYITEPTSTQAGTFIYLQSLQNQYKINTIFYENILKKINIRLTYDNQVMYCYYTVYIQMPYTTK
jgi:hypothetical protein